MGWTIWLQKAASVNIEVARDDDLAAIARLHFSEQLFGRGIRGSAWKVRVHARPQRNRGVIQNQQFRFGLGSELGQLGRRGMIHPGKGLEHRRTGGERSERVDLV